MTAEYIAVDRWSLDSRVPTVVVMHALTSDARVLGALVVGGKPW